MRIMDLTTKVLILMSTLSLAHAQTKSIALGDTLPEIEINNILNGNSMSLNSNSLRGKVLILDFWSTYCSSCIASFPKLDALQEKFADDLVLLAITSQSKATVGEFWRNNSITKGLSLQVVAEDTVLKRLFPHVGVPHFVWIDRNGVIQAITKGEYMDESNIKKLIDGVSLNLPENKVLSTFKNHTMVDVNPSFVALNQPMVYTALGGYLEGFSRQKHLLYDTLKHTTKFQAINFPIITLYKTAVAPIISGENHIPDNRILLEVKDMTKYRYSADYGYYDGWLRNNSFSYEVHYPSKISQFELYETMLTDLNRFFKLNGHLEERRVECFVLKKSHQKMSLPSGQKYIDYTSGALFERYLNSMSDLPAFVQDSIGEGFRLSIPAKKMDFDELVEYIHHNGYVLVREYRKVKMLVISENHQHFDNVTTDSVY